ncbi:MAG: hypothetical protein R6X02_14030 [Enhygromyxa sp.]
MLCRDSALPRAAPPLADLNPLFARGGGDEPPSMPRSRPPPASA